MSWRNPRASFAAFRYGGAPASNDPGCLGMVGAAVGVVLLLVLLVNLGRIGLWVFHRVPWLFLLLDLVGLVWSVVWFRRRPRALDEGTARDMLAWWAAGGGFLILYPRVAPLADRAATFPGSAATLLGMAVVVSAAVVGAVVGVVHLVERISRPPR